MKNRILIVLFLFATLSFNSCTKQGAQGPQGATGAPGSPGANLFSYQFPGNIPINSNNGFMGSAPLYYYIQTAPLLDNSPSNLVEVYYNVGLTAGDKVVEYTPLPAQNIFVNGDELYFTYGDNMITIYYGGSGVSSPPPVQINYWIDIVQK